MTQYSDLRNDDDLDEMSIALTSFHDDSVSANAGHSSTDRSTPESGKKEVPVREFEIESPVDDLEFDELAVSTGKPLEKVFEGHKVVLETKDIGISSKLRVQFFTACLELFMLGLMDQTLGAVMEHVLADYSIDRIKVSYLFLVGTLGYMPASFLNHFLIYNYGLFRVYIAGMFFLDIGAFIYGLKSPYPCLIAASLINGFGSGLADCCANIFVGNLKHSNQLLGVMHACYGLGCLTSPISVIYLIGKGFPWAHFYFIIDTVGLINIVIVASTFRNETCWKFRYVSNLERKATGDDKAETTTWETFHNKYVLFYSLALFVYIGSELSVDIWLFNYVFNIKHMSEKYSSYITSGYWSFMTMGRFVLGFVTGKFFEGKEMHAIVLYCGLVAGFCTGFWALQSKVVIQTVCIFCMGFFVGPLFSTTIVIALTTLPMRYTTSGVSLIAGLGGSGAAVIPPIMGFIAEKFGGGDGEGLVYFPSLVLASFSTAALLWLSFYITHRSTIDSGKRLG